MRLLTCVLNKVTFTQIPGHLGFNVKKLSENLLSNIKYMDDKCRKFGLKNILVSGLVFTTRVSLEVLEKIHDKLHTFCSSYGLTYIDSRNIRGIHLCQNNLHLL